jgi:hypothetical protein
MVVPSGTEEMVAVAAVDHGRIDHTFYRAGEFICACSFYLLAFLIFYAVVVKKLSGQGNRAGYHGRSPRALYCL